MSATPAPRRSRRRHLAVAGLAAIGLSACAQDAPQDTWAPAGDNAQQIHDLQWPIFLLAGIVGVIVMVVVTFVVVKFKDRGQPIPEQTHGKAWLEYLFIAIPAVILVSIAVPTVSVGMIICPLVMIGSVSPLLFWYSPQIMPSASTG